MITLRRITMDNFHDVLNLELTDDDKKMVAPNMYSLAEAYADQVSIARAVYEGDTLVGFVMYDYNAPEKKGYLSRLMIASAHQGRGYGREALRLAVEDLKRSPGIERIQISYHPDNEKARRSYRSVGFIENGEMVQNEVVAMLELIKK
jgi:diamine N-acetyltransferase